MTEAERAGVPLEELVEKWREAARELEADGGQSWKVETYFDCADELEAALARRAPEPESQEYYGRAVDLVADALDQLAPEDLDVRRAKLVAVLRNAAHYFGAAALASRAAQESQNLDESVIAGTDAPY